MESIRQTFNGATGYDRKVTCTVSRNGDLIHRVYVQAELPEISSGIYRDWAGHQLIKSVEVEIGGQRIDKHYGDWLHIWNELSQTEGHWDGYRMMVDGYNTDNALSLSSDNKKDVELFTSHFNFGSAETQVWLFH